jgi:hypothetical protein
VYLVRHTLTKSVISALLLILGSIHAGAQSDHLVGSGLPKFIGREVRVHEPEVDDVFSPKGAASVCVEGPPQEQCYIAPNDFGRNTTVVLIQLRKDMHALLFLAESGDVTSFDIHFSLLRPGTGRDLEDLLLGGVSLSNVGQHAFWSEPAISDAKIFLTADVVQGPDEVHYGDRRFMISAYFPALDDPNYYLEDRYMTVRKYGLRSKAGVLASERQEILARLKRLVAAQRSRLTPPRPIR